MRYGPDLDKVPALPIDVEEADRNRVAESIRAYLRGGQSLAWAVGIVRSSMFQGQSLRAILDSLDQVLPLDELGKRKMTELRNELVEIGFL